MTKRCLAFLAVALLFALGENRAFAQPASAASPTPAFDLKAAVLADDADVKAKLVSLAEATPAEKFSWHPQEGGRRSISAVYLYVTAENIYYATFMGAPAPAGFDFKTFETSTTDKAMVIDQLNSGFDFFANYVKGMSDADLEKHYKAMGHDWTGYDILLHLMGETHERLAQAISFSRTVGVAPPWEKRAPEAAKPQQ